MKARYPGACMPEEEKEEWEVVKGVRDEEHEEAPPGGESLRCILHPVT